MCSVAQNIELFTWHNFYKQVLKAILDQKENLLLFKRINDIFESLFCRNGEVTYKFDTSHLGYQEHFSSTLEILKNVKSETLNINALGYVQIKDKEFQNWNDFYQEIIKSLINKRKNIHIYQSESRDYQIFICGNQIYCEKLKAFVNYSSSFKTSDKYYQKHFALMLDNVQELKTEN